MVAGLVWGITSADGTRRGEVLQSRTFLLTAKTEARIICPMHIIARPKLREFQEKFSDAAASLERWYTSCRENQFKNFPELKLTFKAADLVGKCVVFNIRGNKYRLLVFEST